MPTPQIDPNPVDDRSEKNIQTLLLGLSWGGDWTSRKDEPHYELRPGWARDMSEDAMLAEFRARKDSGKALFA